MTKMKVFLGAVIIAVAVFAIQVKAGLPPLPNAPVSTNSPSSTSSSTNTVSK